MSSGALGVFLPQTQINNFPFISQMTPTVPNCFLLFFLHFLQIVMVTESGLLDFRPIAEIEEQQL